MKHHAITDRRTGKVIYEGRFASLRHCLESAVSETGRLDYADLAGANLVNASLDGASFRHASFKGANMMGANLSEAFLDGADFSDANLQASSLCHASLRACNFADTAFGATDISGCDIGGSLFSSLSAFSLNFASAASMHDCRYYMADRASSLMTYPPVVILGLSGPVVLMDDHIMIGGALRALFIPAAITTGV